MAGSGLLAVGIVEKDTNGDVILAWCFPALEKEEENVLRARSGLSEAALEPAFRFSRFKNSWQYLYSVAVEHKANPKVTATCVCVTATIFNPPKFQALLKLLSDEYYSKGQCTNALPVMSAFLSVMTKGKFGSFDGDAFDPRRALVGPIKTLFEYFGRDAVVLWIAVLLKKRIFVYAENLEELLTVINCFPLFAWHRMDWNILRPWVSMTDAEMSEVRSLGVYVAGFSNSTCARHTDMYDLFVDVTARSINVTEQARADLALSSFHSELADQFLQCCEEQNDQGVIKFIASKTRELLAQLEGLKGTDESGASYVTFEAIAAKNLPQHMDRFLFNLAMAEKLVKPS